MPRKTFWISNKDVLDKLESVENQSKYVTDLIINDILRNDGVLEKDIQDTLNDLIKKIDLLKNKKDLHK